MGDTDWNEHYTSFLYTNPSFHLENEDGAIAHLRWCNNPPKKKVIL